MQDLCTASQGFGKADRSKGDSKLSHEAKKGKGGSTVRIEPNNLLKIFFESPDKDAVAEEHEASLSEKFFIVLDSFMGLVSYLLHPMHSILIYKCSGNPYLRPLQIDMFSYEVDPILSFPRPPFPSSSPSLFPFSNSHPISTCLSC